MTFNTTSVTGYPSLSNATISKNVSSYQGLKADSANNLGYGLGRIARSAFEQIYQACQGLWVSEPSPEENAMRKQITIFRNGLRKCVQKLNATLDNLHPYDPSKLAKIQSLVTHCADYLKPQEKAEFQAFQKKALQPLEAKISKIAHPHIRKALRQLLPVLFQGEKFDNEHAQSKRAVQQTSEWPASFNLTTLDGTNGFAIPGIAASGILGYSASTAGDLNGDGKADLVLGTPGALGTGAAYVLFGQAGGWPAFFNLTTLNGTNGFVIPGIAANGSLGVSVSTAGDLNGDGKTDLVLGAYRVSSLVGAAYVIFGQAGGWPASFNLSSLNGTNGFVIPGIAASGLLGNSVSTAGDLNGDGKADLVLSAPRVSSNTGATYVIFGRVGGWPASFNLASLNGTNGFAIPGIVGGGELGWSVSTAGDLNGDGKADLVFGAPSVSLNNNGAVYVLFGQAGRWSASFSLMTLNGTNGFAVPGIAVNGQLGTSVSTAGDRIDSLEILPVTKCCLI